MVLDSNGNLCGSLCIRMGFIHLVVQNEDLFYDNGSSVVHHGNFFCFTLFHIHPFLQLFFPFSHVA